MEQERKENHVKIKGHDDLLKRSCPNLVQDIYVTLTKKI